MGLRKQIANLLYIAPQCLPGEKARERRSARSEPLMLGSQPDNQ
jgi:hypothetical protein